MDFCGHSGGFECFSADHHAHPSQEEHLAQPQGCGCGCAGTNLTSRRAKEVPKKGNLWEFIFQQNHYNHNTVGVLDVPHDWDGLDGQRWSVQTQPGCHIKSGEGFKYFEIISIFVWLHSHDSLSHIEDEHTVRYTERHKYWRIYTYKDIRTYLCMCGKLEYFV